MGGAATIVVALVVAGFGMFGIGWRVRGRIAGAEKKTSRLEAELVTTNEARAELVTITEALRQEVIDAKSEATFWETHARNAGVSPGVVWASMSEDEDANGDRPGYRSMSGELVTPE